MDNSVSDTGSLKYSTSLSLLVITGLIGLMADARPSKSQCCTSVVKGLNIRPTLLEITRTIKELMTLDNA